MTKLGQSVFLLAIVLSSCVCLSVPNIDERINWLHNLVINCQDQQDTEFKGYPWTWEQMKGMYVNEVRLNFHGNIENALIRENFKVPDNNMFTAAWVTIAIIEAYEYGITPKPRDVQIKMALDVIDKFRNRNVAYNNSEMSFWMQKLNKTAMYYQSSPTNLFGVLDLPAELPDKLIEMILEKLGLKGFAFDFERLVNSRNMFLAAFHIPPDFDDTFVNLGLGGLLSFFQQDFPDHHTLWKQQNTNLTSIFNSARKYAYRPFSGDQRINTIDPRTYFYMRQFLDEAASNKQNLALIPTWIQDTDEVRVQFDKGVVMPFNVNNVDVTVSANFLYGVVVCVGTSVCTNPDGLIDSDIQQIFENTTSLIVHEIRTNLSSRPDLALTYYPSKFEFYWFVSRSVAWINRHLTDVMPSLSLRLQKMLVQAKNSLAPVLRKEMTTDVLNSATWDVDKDYAHVDNFLGDADLDSENNTLPRWEDRIFSTSVSVNALINTWTNLYNGSLIWDKDTPSEVKTFVESAVRWLTDYVETDDYKLWNTFFSGSGKGRSIGAYPAQSYKTFVESEVRWLTDYVETDDYKLWNTFFSGSGKGRSSLPFAFPANRMEFFNGTTFKDDKFPETYKNIQGMQGYVTPTDYDVLLKKPHFGMMTPMTFDGYNSEADGFFPFWSSDAYTYATSLVALSHFRNIRED